MSRVVVVMGVSGCGKSTVARRLAVGLRWTFLEADDFHSDQARQQMARNIPLTDADREPWMAAIVTALSAHLEQGNNIVMACSCLRRRHRDLIRSTALRVSFLWLTGQPETIRNRLDRRFGHFMPASLLRSQLRDLEPPVAEPDVVRLKVEWPLENVLDCAMAAISGEETPC